MRKKNFLFIVFFLVGLTIVVSSCKTENGDENTKSMADELKGLQPAESTSGRDTVVISGMKFQPEHLTIHKGDTVVWINNGVVVHDVTEELLQSWTSDSIQTGETWSMVPEEGFKYICSIHPTMKGSISVREE